ncbi:autotransporter-associated beta strand repeat-containing protein [Luteolibacter flavescens]|uniref:Autotransporter-associated beta strand repeat-containing protein n=1 Tax=Luteolibacter flavescens TaxID=1859460 RepID=A0ABT3FKI5_9BACT|nr:autotransporter-associated beta strand repeat-containing protein [Luteolibacter flavescens]MCW1884088.1 autotransporter-associated beta strand repeat-containing protein [Luteolibacter flavescens]
MNTRTLTTRACLSATASHNARWFAGLVAGAAALVAPVATAENWNGGVSSDWNDAANWTPNTVPNTVNAVINTVTPRYPILTNNPLHNVNDLLMGIGTGSVGRLDQSAGLLHSNAWIYLGSEGGSATLNLTGSSTLEAGGRLWVGGSQLAGGGIGVATVNTTGGITTVSDVGVGSSGGTGTLNLQAGTINSGGWTFIGKREAADNASGTVNISGGTWNHVGTRTFVGLGQSVGKLNISGGTYNNTAGGNDVFMAVGVNNNGASAPSEVNLTGGNLNVNRVLSVGGGSGEGGNTNAGFQGGGKGKLTVNSPSSVLGVAGELWVGQDNGANGEMTVDAGTVNAGSWVAVARRTGSTGKLTMNGGTLAKTGDGQFIVGDGGTGRLELPAGKTGAVTINNDMWVGQSGTGNGTVELHSGSISVGGWVPIGREGGVGVANMSGGTWNQNGTGQAFIVGSTGKGTMNMTGGTVNVGRLTWIAEGNGANESLLTLSGTAVFNTPIMSVGPEANGTLQLNTGGTLRTGRITGLRASDTGNGFNAGGGLGTINFNGGQIVATQNQDFFIADVDVINVAADGLHIDSNGFNLTVPASLPGPGGVFKSGAGTLTLAGTNTFTGIVSVTGGTLVLSTATTSPSAYTIGAAGALRADQASPTGRLAMPNLNLASGSQLIAGAAPATGNPASSVFQVAGNVALTGPTALGLVDTQPVAGLFPVLSYGTKSGTGSFVAGTVPSGVILDTTTPIVETGNVVSLNIVRAVAPRWVGGGNGGIWDTTTSNWTNSFNGATVPFANGDPATFDDIDSDPATYNVVLNTIVTPGGAGVIFDNDLAPFTLNTSNGNGKITGSAGLTKRGFEGLVIGNLANEFTGPVRIEEGSITVGQLANAADASPLGKGQLVLAGGALNYTGAAVTIDRGFQINAATNTATSELNIASNVTMSGAVTATNGKFRLSGAGVLTLSHAGPISLANGPQDSEPASFVINGGGLTLNGAGQVATVNGNTQIALTDGVTTNVSLTGNAILNVNRFQAGFGTGSTTNIVVQDSARINKSGMGWFSIANSNNAAATMTIRNSGSLVTAGGDFNVGDTASSNGTLNLQDNATVTAASPIYVGKNSATGRVNLSGASTMTVGNADIAGGDNSVGELNLAGTSTFTSTGRMLVGPGGTSNGSVTVDGSATVQVNSYVSVGFTGGGTATVKGDGTFNTNDDFSVNEASPIPALVTVQDTGALSVGGTLFIGRNADRIGVLDVKGTATLDQTGSAAQNFFVGLAGNGTLDISGNAVVTAASANGVVIGQDEVGVGTVNLNGGTLVTKRVFGNNGTSTFNFNGGLLRAGAGANADFIAGIDTAVVATGGAKIDSNGQTVAVSVPLVAGTPSGGLTKSGTGTLRLNGVNTYTGATTVSAGNLGGTGTIAGPITVQSGAGIAPGAATGTLTASGGVTLSAGSNFVVTLNDSQAENSSRLSVPGALNVAGVNLQVNLGGAAAQASYTIATAGSVTGTFASVPAGVTVTYNATSITITPPSATPFQSWIGAFNVGTLTQPGDDADGDGMTNLEEFALDGDPSKGAASGKVRSRIETVGGQQALVITLPVRAGATFDNTPGPGMDATVAADGVTYIIRGSNNLTAFDQGVSEVTPASAANMPPLSDGTKWTYRTFRLNGAIPARGTKGFLDIQIQPAP